MGGISFMLFLAVSGCLHLLGYDLTPQKGNANVLLMESAVWVGHDRA